MAIYQLKTFEDLYKAVLEEIKEQEDASTDLNRIRRDINICYLDEIVPFKRWWWLRGHTDVDFPAYLSTGTATVTSASPVITLTEGFGSSQKNNYFSVDGDREIYKIKSHTAASTSLVLDRPYRGTTSSTATFKIWQDFAPLPPDCKETFEVWHDHNGEPLRGIGFQDYRKICTASSKAVARPVYYSTGDFFEESAYSSISGLPASTHRISTGRIRKVVFASAVSSYLETGDRIEVSGSSSYYYNAEAIVAAISTTTATNDTVEYIVPEPATESSTADTAIIIKLKNVEGASERFRKLHVYPYLCSSTTTLHVDYVIQAPPLENASDEPLMPLEDRVAILYGTLSRTWARYRNPEEAARNKMLYEQKLARMAAKTEDSLENPTLRPSRIYLGVKRHEPERFENDGGWGGGSSVTTISGTANRVVQFNSSGELSSSDITTTELGYLDDVTSNIQTQLNAKLDEISSTTDNALVRWDGAAGAAVQNSVVTVSDAGVVAGATQLDVDNVRVDGNTISSTNSNGDINLTPNGTGSVVVSKTEIQDGIIETTTEIVDPTTNSKALDFSLSGATASTKLTISSSQTANRTLTIPDATTTMVGTDTTQTLTNKTLTSPTITTPTITVLDSALTVQDNSDNTKQMQFQLSSITTGTTRTYTMPDVSDTLVTLGATQTLTSKTLTTPTITVLDNALTVQDNSDNTKQFQVQLSSITTGTTRTMTVPDADFTAVGTATTQTLTNKTVALASNTVTGANNDGVVYANGSGTLTNSTSLTYNGSVLRSGIFAATRSDFDAGGAAAITSLTTSTSFVRITNTNAAGFSVRGIGSTLADGKVVHIYNNSGNQMTISNESGSAGATERILTLTGADVTLGTGDSFASLIYDSNGGRWILMSTNG